MMWVWLAASAIAWVAAGLVLGLILGPIVNRHQKDEL